MKITTSFTKALATSMLIVFGAAAQVTAATFTVTNTADSWPGSLRQAVLDANATPSADTIVFDSGLFSSPQTITLASEIRISDNFNSVQTLTIIGPGADLLTISGNGVTRMFLTIQEDTASISGMTLTGGNASSGGAIQNGGVTTLSGIVFTQNTSDTGGAVYNTVTGVLNVNGCVFRDNTTIGANINGDGGSAITNRFGALTVTDSLITGGTTRGGGGGLRIENGVVNISNTTISNNTSGGAGNTRGGGGIIVFGELTLTDCIISGNTAGEGTDGGGILNEGQLRLVRSIVTGNTAGRHGGGIYDGAALGATIIDSTISNNTANTAGIDTGRGGGIYVESDPGVTVTGSTISGNTSPGHGGGIFTNGTFTLKNTTVSGNSAGTVGGGIYDDHPGGPGGVVTLDSSTIVNNQANQVGGVENRAPVGNPAVSIRNTIIANNTGGTTPDVRNAFNSQGYNLIENTTGASIVGDTATNITGVDPNLGSLADNGGLTFTHALLAGSPAIDKGNSFGTTTDQRGFTRPFDFGSIANASGGDGADIGAYEVDPTPPVLVSARSEMVHGDLGTFGVNLPLTDTVGIESRRGAGSGEARNYTIVLTFNRPVNGGSASMLGVGNVGSVSFNGADMIVSLIGVTDAQVVTLTASNVTTQDGGILNADSVQIGFLIGDVNGSGSVNVGDALLTRNRSGQTVDANNFRTDVNPDGVINTGDALIVRSRSGNSLDP